MKNKEIKLIAVDLDGTLLNDRHELTPGTETAIKKALDRGIPVILATGKTRHSSGELVKRLGLKTPGVYSQGLIVADPDGTIRHQIYLPDALAEEIIRAADQHGISFVVYKDKEIFCIRNDHRTDILTEYQEPYPQAAGSIDGLLANAPFQKFIFFDEPDRLTALRPTIEKQFAGRAALVFSNPAMLEILPLGTSKGGGLQLLLDDLGIAPAQVIAFGDADNDIEMLALAGIGVAMGNAMPGTKAVADFVTGTNNEDGLADALNRLVFHPLTTSNHSGEKK